MKEMNFADIFTPEAIDAICRNADNLSTLITALRSGDEKNAVNGPVERCCCPQWLKFKFFFCNVKIVNENAECRKKDMPLPC